MFTTSSGLEYEDLKKGAGPPATPGDVVVVHYTGWLTDGKQFDSSVGGAPFQARWPPSGAGLPAKWFAG